MLESHSKKYSLVKWAANKSPEKLKANFHPEKYAVLGSMLTLDEIKDIVSKEISSEQKLVNEKRTEESKAVMNTLMSKECEVSRFSLYFVIFEHFIF